MYISLRACTSTLACDRRVWCPLTETLANWRLPVNVWVHLTILLELLPRRPGQRSRQDSCLARKITDVHVHGPSIKVRFHSDNKSLSPSPNLFPPQHKKHLAKQSSGLTPSPSLYSVVWWAGDRCSLTQSLHRWGFFFLVWVTSSRPLHLGEALYHNCFIAVVGDCPDTRGGGGIQWRLSPPRWNPTVVWSHPPPFLLSQMLV